MINYSCDSGVATIQFDDGKANVFSVASAAEMQAALSRAEEEASVVVFRGRAGQFSAGFDLKTFQTGNVDLMREQAVTGFEVLCRMVQFPLPFITVSEGHAIGMGAFILLAADTRIAVDAPCKIGLPETAIGMPLEPNLLRFIAKDRLSSNHYITAALQSKMYQPDEAVAAGFLDAVVSQGDLEKTVDGVVEQLKGLPKDQYATNKRALKAELIQAINEDLELAKNHPEQIF